MRVEKIIFGGKGLSRDLGKTVFIDGALASEMVEAEVISEKSNFIEAKVSQILEASPSRVKPPCRYVGWCGGCQYQHMNYDEERRTKEAQILEMLASFVITPKTIEPIRFSNKEYGYRNSVTFHRVAGDKKQKAQVGFVGLDNKTIISVSECLLLDPALSDVWTKSGRSSFKEKKMTFKLSENKEIISDYEARFFRIRVLGDSLITSSKGFFQNNLAVTELLVQTVTGWIAAAKPGLLLDLFSGMGLFSLLSAKDVPEIVCVEESGASLEALKMNIEEKKRSGLTIREGRVENIYSPLSREGSLSGSVILMDPPRQGLERKLALDLSRSDAARIIYISCDIPSLARDLTLILSGGHYQVESIVPFDMFPKTKHIEAAVLLTSKTS